MKSDLFDIKQKHAIVVGGTGDLGWAIGKSYAEAGASVVVIDIKPIEPEQLGSLSDTTRKKITHISADITDREQVYASFEKARIHFAGRIDILVNSAGIQRRFPSEDFPDNEWDNVLNVNLTATFLYCKLAAKNMILQGSGKIINIASMQSFFGGLTIPAYAASKGGVSQLTKALSNDWASKGININAIAPGYMDTKMNTALINDPVRNAEVLSRIPQKRWGKGEDLKGIAIFLASEASDYLNGTIIPVDGGFSGR